MRNIWLLPFAEMIALITIMAGEVMVNSGSELNEMIKPVMVWNAMVPSQMD